jgi:uncharacterized protein (TIGR03083 family)
MTTGQASIEEVARTYARTASDGFADTAQYLRSLSDEDWEGPTGCTDWTVRDLAGHIVGEAVWFPNLVEGVTKGAESLPMELYQAMKSYPRDRITHDMEDAAHDLWSAIDEASTDQLRQPVDMGFTRLPIWRATFVSANEAVVHNWDARAGLDPTATIRAEWAVVLSRGMNEFAPLIASKEGISEAPGTYLLRVGNGVGPVTITARDGKLTVKPGSAGSPDVTLDLTADQYVRLVEGRLNLAEALERGDIAVEGARERTTALNQIFRGI